MSGRSEQSGRWVQTLDSHTQKAIQRFLDDGATGQISLNVNRGRIESCDTRRHMRVKRDLDTGRGDR